MNKENLIDIASNLRELSENIESANDKLRHQNVKELQTEINSYNDVLLALNHVIKKRLINIYGDLHEFINKLKLTQLVDTLVASSLRVYTNEWDSLYDCIKNLNKDCLEIENFDGSKETMDKVVDVKKWGYVVPKYDVNFLKQLRSGIAHSRFEFDDGNIVISMRASDPNQHFLVELPTMFATRLPKHIWDLAKNEPLPHATEPRAFTLNGKVCRFMAEADGSQKKAEKALEGLKNLGLPQECLDKLSQFTKDESTNKLGIKAKVDYLCSFTQHIKSQNDSINNVKNKVKLIFEAGGLNVKECEIHDINKEVYKQNAFLQLFEFPDKSNMRTKNNVEDLTSRVIMAKNDLYSENYIPYQMLTNLMLFSYGVPVERLADDMFKENIMMGDLIEVPFLMDEISTFTDKAYYYFAFNYMIENLGKPKFSKNVNATEYFKENEYTKNLKLSDAITTVRHCLVHSDRMVNNIDKNGQACYTLTDYDNNGKLVFKAQITKGKLKQLTEKIIDEMKREHNLQNEESINE